MEIAYLHNHIYSDIVIKVSGDLFGLLFVKTCLLSLLPETDPELAYIAIYVII